MNYSGLNIKLHFQESVGDSGEMWVDSYKIPFLNGPPPGEGNNYRFAAFLARRRMITRLRKIEENVSNLGMDLRKKLKVLCKFQ